MHVLFKSSYKYLISYGAIYLCITIYPPPLYLYPHNHSDEGQQSETLVGVTAKYPAMNLSLLFSI